MKIKYRLILAVVIVIIVEWFTFGHLVDFDFVNFDDDFFILNNAMIRILDWQAVKTIFTNTVSDNYVPLTILSFAVEHSLYGFNPFFFHLDNILLHMAITCFIFVFATRCKLSFTGALFAALFFCLHPPSLEAVAWITARKDMLYCVMYMLSLLLYVLYWQKGKKYLFYLSVLIGALSVLAKSAAVTLPVVLLLCDWFLKRKWSKDVFLDKVPLLILMWLFVQPTFGKIGVMTMSNPFASLGSVYNAILLRLWAYTFYLFQFFSQGPYLVFYRPPYPVSIFNPEYLVSCLFFIIILTLIILLRKQRSIVFSILFYTITVSPMLILVGESYIISTAPRYIYLAKMGFCILVGFILDYYIINSSKRYIKFLACTLAVCLLAVFAQTTKRESMVWKNGMSLWRQQIKYNPGIRTCWSYYKLGHAYMNDSLFKERLSRLKSYKEISLPAEPAFRIQLDEDIKNVNYVISIIYKSIKCKKNYAASYFLLGDIYKALGDNSKAVFYYSKPLNFESVKDKMEAYYYLGKMYLDSGNYIKAKEMYMKSINSYEQGVANYYKIIKDYQNLKKEELFSEDIQTDINKYKDLYHQKVGIKINEMFLR